MVRISGKRFFTDMGLAKEYNNANSHYWRNLEKMNDQIFQQLQKPCFLVHLRGIFFLLKTRLRHTQLGMRFKHYPKFWKKLIIQFQENIITEGTTDGRPLFYRTLPTTAKGRVQYGNQNYYKKHQQNLQDNTTVCFPPHLISWISSFL